MTIDKKKIERNLQKKGFILDVSRDHKYFHHEYKGILTGIFTYISHGSAKEIDNSLISKMQKQLKLEKKYLACDLFTCPMSGDDYLDILKENNLIHD